MDRAGLLSSKTLATLEFELEKLEEETGAQVVVLTIDGLRGDPIEDYSMRVVDSWQLGRANLDNGVLILIARDDRAIRIEVGYGLEGVLPDVLCARIIDNAMTPAFKRGDFSGGTLRAVRIITGLIEGDPDAPAELAKTSYPMPEVGVLVVMIPVFILVIGSFALTALLTKGSGGWLLYLFLIPFLFGFPGAALGPLWGVVIAGAWLIGFPILRALIWHTGTGENFRTSHPTWTTFGSPGGSWGGGGFGGGFGGGGFSGGGGSFGGGGASGGW
jgi:uncharacterized protein